MEKKDFVVIFELELPSCFLVDNTPVGTPKGEDKNEDDFGDGEDKEEEDDGEEAGSDDGAEQEDGGGADDGEDDDETSKSTSSDASKEDIQKKIEKLSKVTLLFNGILMSWKEECSNDLRICHIYSHAHSLVC